MGTLCHHLDMGGMAAGSYAANATEIFQEGLRIPPLKLFRRGVLNEEVLALLRQNVRRGGAATPTCASLASATTRRPWWQPARRSSTGRSAPCAP